MPEGSCATLHIISPSTHEAVSKWWTTHGCQHGGDILRCAQAPSCAGGGRLSGCVALVHDQHQRPQERGPPCSIDGLLSCSTDPTTQRI